MAFTAISSSGAKLRASLLATWFSERTPVTASKAGDTSRNTTVARTADPDLSITLTPGVWEVEVLAILTSAANAAGDWSMELAYPSDATVTAGALGPGVTLASGVAAPDVNSYASSLDATTPTTNYNFGCSTTATATFVRARITIVTTGAVTVNWAQEISNGNNTTLKGGSAITGRMVA